MDFTTRGTSDSGTKDKRIFKEMRLFTYLMLILAAGLVLSLAALFAFGEGRNESSYIDSEKLQAVFLSDGQTYFGRIRSLNDRYLRLDTVFYSLYGGKVQPDEHPGQGALSVFKLGCERHAPTDQMVINRQQVAYWENLKSDSPVITAINKYVKDNPKGTCPPASVPSTKP